MTNLRRGMLFFPFVILALAVPLFAQDNTLTVAGSSVALPIVQLIAETYAPTEVTITPAINGTADGFAQLCAGTVDAVAASRALSTAEETVCNANGIQFHELVLGYDYLVFVGNAADTFNVCLAASTLNNLFAPSASESVTNWTGISAENPDLPITLYVPASNTLSGATLDNFIAGTGIRSDALVATPVEAITAVNATTGAIAVVPFSSLLAVEGEEYILSVDFQTSSVGCVSPAVDAFENGIYTLGTNFYFYISTTAATRVPTLLESFVTTDSTFLLEGLGFTAPTSTVRDLNAQAITTLGRLFTRQQETFEIPIGLAGEVTLGGNPALNTWLKAAADSFAQTYPDLKFTLKFEGEPSGLRRFCNGELDIIASEVPLSGEAATNCEANSITTFDVTLGTKAVVLVGNALDTEQACLTLDQISTIWNTASEKVVTNWTGVDVTFADKPLTLFAPTSSDAADLLLRRGDTIVPPLRSDVAESNDDPLYRAAAVANVPGALTFMTWREYGQVLATGQERIQLVNVQADGECVTPSDATIADSTYPITETATLIVNTSSLANINVQSYLWTLFDSITQYANYEALGYTGLASDFFVDVRSNLLVAFAEAEAALAVPEVTAEPGIEVTAEATGEATAEVTMEATVEVTLEATAEATIEATEEATQEPTAVPTPEATEEATAEATASS